jgi:hypothetical protein
MNIPISTIGISYWLNVQQDNLVTNEALKTGNPYLDQMALARKHST